VADSRVVIIGAGMGGLAAAIDLATRGCDVTVLERAASVGGKMREIAIPDPGRAGGVARIDAGPTVLTMRDVFEGIFADAGANLADHVTLRPAGILARHAWSVDQRLDLHADLECSVDAIGAFAGAAEARRYRAFCAQARHVFDTLDQPFMRSADPSPLSLMRAAGVGAMLKVAPFGRLWAELGRYFTDPRLHQLFGRYATYCGASPYLAPATLMLVAHVERAGVWLVDGGMHRLAQAMADLAQAKGARLRTGIEVVGLITSAGRAAGVTLSTGERIAADMVVSNADPAAMSAGVMGPEAARATRHAAGAGRSLSAVTWAMTARTSGFPLARHNVFFSRHYQAEFDDIAHGALPSAPTVYVCAQDRETPEWADADHRSERLLCLVNAPPVGDRHPFTAAEIAQCEQQTFSLLQRCGLSLERRPESTVITTPAQFDQLYRGTGGALYGPALDGWRAAFQRPRARATLPGLYLAGGGAHPGPGAPMAALSGRMAAAAVLRDGVSIASSLGKATPGGMSMRSATMAATD
jgi:1-hydroxycarotenoid 3,4-desaturase